MFIFFFYNMKRGGEVCVFFFQAEDGIRDGRVTGVQTCALPILSGARRSKNRHTSSSPTPSERSPSPPTLPSRTAKRSPCARRWPGTCPRHARQPARTSRAPVRHRSDTREQRHETHG